MEPSGNPRAWAFREGRKAAVGVVGWVSFGSSGFGIIVSIMFSSGGDSIADRQNSAMAAFPITFWRLWRGFCADKIQQVSDFTLAKEASN